MTDALLKIGKFAALTLITILVILFLILSFVPLVTLYAGIISLVWVNLAWFLYFRKQHKPRRIYKFWYTVGIVTMFFGFFVHMGCRLYSNSRVSQLQKECSDEKNNVFLNNKINIDGQIILPK